MFFIDSHCHLDQLNYSNIHKDVSDVLNKAKMSHIRSVLSVSVSLDNFTKLTSLVGSRRDVLFSCGIHPFYLSQSNDISNLSVLSNHENVVAIGETGLDYFHLDNKKQQQESFQDHLYIAYQKNKPVIVHSRSAFIDTLNILRKTHFVYRGVLHCFTGDKSMARALLDLGFYISFSGIITFQKSNNLRNVVSYVPLNRILLESDAPYLAPVPYRGCENQPAYVYNVAQRVAEIKNIALEELAHITTDNFNQLFHVNLNI